MKYGEPFRAMVAGLAAMGSVTLRGQEYRGEYLSALVAINPETPAAESARTTQLISEMGRLTAAALKEKEMADVRYRVWRSQTVTELTTDAETCENLGLVKEGSGKALSKTAAEEALKQLPEYLNHYETMKLAEEVHGVLYAAYEAAKARQWAIRAFEGSGGVITESREHHRISQEEASTTTYHGGHNEDPMPALEREAAQVVRTPLPQPPPGPPPGPPGPTNPPPSRKAAPPPPPHSRS